MRRSYLYLVFQAEVLGKRNANALEKQRSVWCVAWCQTNVDIKKYSWLSIWQFYSPIYLLPYLLLLLPFLPFFLWFNSLSFSACLTIKTKWDIIWSILGQSHLLVGELVQPDHLVHLRDLLHWLEGGHLLQPLDTLQPLNAFNSLQQN